MQSALERERRAHQAAVQKFVAEMEARARLAVEADNLKVCVCVYAYQ
jgi:hypothetical protein